MQAYLKANLVVCIMRIIIYILFTVFLHLEFINTFSTFLHFWRTKTHYFTLKSKRLTFPEIIYNWNYLQMVITLFYYLRNNNTKHISDNRYCYALLLCSALIMSPALIYREIFELWSVRLRGLKVRCERNVSSWSSTSRIVTLLKKIVAYICDFKRMIRLYTCNWLMYLVMLHNVHV